MSQKLTSISNDTNVGSQDEIPGHRLETNSRNLSISPELFEKLYFPARQQNQIGLSQAFGNPTPVAIMGLVVAITPLSIELMGWRGANGLLATNGANYFFGGLLLILSGIGEFLIGKTFPSVVFLGYGAHFLTVAVTFTPFYHDISAYTTDGSQLETPPFMVSFGFYNLFMGLLSLIFLICSFRTNGMFVIIFTGAFFGFAFATGAFWNGAEGSVASQTRLLKATGGSFFVSALAGWYILLSLMAASVEMPFAVPLYDLSNVVKGMNDRKTQHSD